MLRLVSQCPRRLRDAYDHVTINSRHNAVRLQLHALAYRWPRSLHKRACGYVVNAAKRCRQDGGSVPQVPYEARELPIDERRPRCVWGIAPPLGLQHTFLWYQPRPDCGLADLTPAGC
jgi:hypothetical protein